MYGSIPLLFQEGSIPNFIDHGKDRMKYWKKGSHIQYPTSGASKKKINSALQSIETFFAGSTS